MRFFYFLLSAGFTDGRAWKEISSDYKSAFIVGLYQGVKMAKMLDQKDAELMLNGFFRRDFSRPPLVTISQS